MINAAKCLGRISQDGPRFTAFTKDSALPLLRDNVVHENLSETNIEIRRILFENMGKINYALASRTRYLD